MDMMSYLMGRNSGGGGKGAKIEVVTELPETGEANVIYLVPKETEDENNVFDEYLYINDEWELIGSTAIDISGKQDTMQFSTMPNASVDYLGKIVQYTGTTNANYTNGYFYIGITDGAAVPTYSWSNVEVQTPQDLTDLPKKTVLCFSPVFSKGDITVNNFNYTENTSGELLTFLNNNLDRDVMLIINGAGGYSQLFMSIPKTIFDSHASTFRTAGLMTLKENTSSANLAIRQCRINFTWNNDNTKITIASLQNDAYNFNGIREMVNNDNLSQKVLTKTNTNSYVPTSNYHPATKKYVDDSIAAAITATLGGSY